jgi:hypothetical protein
MKRLLSAALVLGLAFAAHAQDKKPEEAKTDKGELVPAPKAKVEEAPPEEEAPSVSTKPPVDLVIFPGEALATPHRKGVSWANGGIIDVSQPNPTTIVVNMTGICATNADLIRDSSAGYHFDLNQCFGVRFNSRKVKGAHLTIESRVAGLLRTNHELYQRCLCKHGGVAECDPATATITACEKEIVSVTLPSHSICCEDDLSIYNHEGPLWLPVTPGKYSLHACWGFGTEHPPFFCRGASAEFAPQPEFCGDAATAYWFQHFRPFNGAATKEFGYQVTIKVIAD